MAVPRLPSGSPAFQEPLELIPVNHSSADEVQELLAQRKVCGWNFTQAYMDKWRNKTENGTMTLFWLTLTSRDYVRAGHVALVSEEDPPSLELANPDRTVMSISTFFIMPQFRGLGLGRVAMDQVEAYATQEPFGSRDCRAVTVNTLARKWFEDDELRHCFAAIGLPTPEKGSSSEDWYARRGYIKFKEEPRYQDNTSAGDSIAFTSSFLRKELQ